MNASIIEALKELARVVVLSVIPILVVLLQSDAIDWRAFAIAASIAALRAVDKFLHELGKEKDSATLTAGLTRF